MGLALFTFFNEEQNTSERILSMWQVLINILKEIKMRIEFDKLSLSMMITVFANLLHYFLLAFTFGIIGVHVSPTDAVREINSLVEVYDALTGQWEIQVGVNVILMVFTQM